MSCFELSNPKTAEAQQALFALQTNPDERVKATQQALLDLINWSIDQVILLERGNDTALTRVSNNVPHAWQTLRRLDQARFA